VNTLNSILDSIQHAWLVWSIVAIFITGTVGTLAFDTRPPVWVRRGHAALTMRMHLVSAETQGLSFARWHRVKIDRPAEIRELTVVDPWDELHGNAPAIDITRDVEAAPVGEMIAIFTAPPSEHVSADLRAERRATFLSMEDTGQWDVHELFADAEVTYAEVIGDHGHPIQEPSSSDWEEVDGAEVLDATVVVPPVWEEHPLDSWVAPPDETYTGSGNIAMDVFEGMVARGAFTALGTLGSLVTHFDDVDYHAKHDQFMTGCRELGVEIVDWRGELVAA